MPDDPVALERRGLTRSRLSALGVLALGLVLVCGCAASPLGDYPWDPDTVLARMRHYAVPAVSVTVIDDSGIAWAGSYGVLESGSDEPVTGETLFQAASIGKSITAVTALHQVRRGALALDEDVATYLSGWTLPENAFTRARPVTVRRLLSHTAGTTVSGFAGYPRGADLPTLRQILDGLPPANSAPVRVDMEPGSGYRYSGGGYLVVQQVLEDVTGQAFEELVVETVFGPLSMTDSVFDPLPEREWHRAASGYRKDGRLVQGRWHTYPELGAGGLWSTPSDMALFGIEVMLAHSGKSDRIITQSLAREMLTPVASDYGLGFGIGNDGGSRLYAMHLGANEGYRSEIVLYPKRGQGIVIMTNSDNGAPLAKEMVESLSRAFGWYSGIILSAVETATLSAAALFLAAGGILLWVRQRRRRRVHEAAG